MPVILTRYATEWTRDRKTIQIIVVVAEAEALHHFEIAMKRQGWEMVKFTPLPMTEGT